MARARQMALLIAAVVSYALALAVGTAFVIAAR
jgi:hypothetical protein